MMLSFLFFRLIAKKLFFSEKSVYNEFLNSLVPNEVTSGGCMPIIQVHMLEGRTQDLKKKLVANMTEAVVKSLGVKPEDVRIILMDMAKSNYAVAGVMKSES
jgi:4-oxalocrotonate tautomerase